MDSAFAIDGNVDLKQTTKMVPTTATRADLPKAIDLSHHLNELARNRTPSSLKELYKYAVIPGMIPLAGGIPSPDNFPFETLSASILPPDHLPLDNPRKPADKSLFSWLFSAKKRLLNISVPKYVEHPEPTSIQLATSLQYQAATGPPALPLFLRKYVEAVYKPAYADWDVLINVGNTDGWSKIVGMLMERGDAILVEEWTYPSAQNCLPVDRTLVSVKMDGEGALPSHLEDILGNWDEKKQGKKRPKVFYTVPTGQNPTGATMGLKRKKAIYEICRKYDVIICEDEPYYCLYSGKWTPQKQAASKSVLERRQEELEKQEGKEGNDAFMLSLPPTFLTVDYEGRVIRMDTFSKTSCPGSRLGWITSSPLFIERLTRASESSTQAPSGFVTAMTTSLINKWTFDGYIRWLRGIKAHYRMRRDWICDAFEDNFHLEFESNTNGLSTNPAVLEVFEGLGRGVTCYAKPAEGSAQAKWDEKRGLASRGPPLVSFIPPTAGMFIWLAVHMDRHPDYQALLHKGEDATAYLMDKLWRELADNMVLFAPGFAFDAHGEHAIGGKGTGYFRVAYSITTYEQNRHAVETFSKVLNKFFRV